MRSRTRLALAALAVALILPTSAQAATKTVVAGPLKAVKGVFGGNATGDVDGYSLKTVTVHVGDKVRWKINGFHRVTFPKKGSGALPFVIPDASAKYSGVNDAAGAPFWFNGQTQLDLNPLAALPQGGKTENGSPVGGSLSLQVKSLPEAHTFTFGPSAYVQDLASKFVTPVPNGAGPPTLAYNGQIAFPSDPPPTLPPYDGTAHGNGFFNTGVLDGDPNTPNPSSAKVTFSKAGT